MRAAPSACESRPVIVCSRKGTWIAGRSHVTLERARTTRVRVIASVCDSRSCGSFLPRGFFLSPPLPSRNQSQLACCCGFGSSSWYSRRSQRLAMSADATLAPFVLLNGVCRSLQRGSCRGSRLASGIRIGRRSRYPTRSVPRQPAACRSTSCTAGHRSRATTVCRRGSGRSAR